MKPTKPTKKADVRGLVGFAVPWARDEMRQAAGRSVAAPATERLWVTEPRRATALSKVTAVRGHAFALDRSLFAPTSVLHRHPQPQDMGTIWLGGEKRRLERTFLKDGALWHQLRGTVPTVGEQAQCQLDADRRLLASRAHTALHLLLAA